MTGKASREIEVLAFYGTDRSDPQGLTSKCYTGCRLGDFAPAHLRIYPDEFHEMGEPPVIIRETEKTHSRTGATSQKRESVTLYGFSFNGKPTLVELGFMLGAFGLCERDRIALTLDRVAQYLKENKGLDIFEKGLTSMAGL